MCLPEAQKLVVDRLYDDLHESNGRVWHDGTETIWAKEFSRLTPWRYRDGVTIWLSKEDHSPGDDFLGQSTPTVDPMG